MKVVVTEVVDEAKRYQCAASMHHIWIDGLGRDPMQWTIGKAMREVGFSETDSKDTTKQMRVRRLKTSGTPVAQTSTPALIVSNAAATPVSEVIEPTLASSAALSARKDILGGCRRTKQQMQAANRVHLEALTAKQENFKNCTSWIAQEQSKHQGIGKKKGVKPLLIEYSEMKNIPLASLPSDRTVRRTLQNGKAGQTPPRRGPKGKIDESDLAMLGEAVRAHVVLCGYYGEKKTYNDLKKLVNTVANSKEDKQLPDLMAKHCAVDPAARHSTSATPSNDLAEYNAVETECLAADNLGEGEEEAVDFVNDSEQNESYKCSEELEKNDKIACISSNEENAPLMAPSDRSRSTRRLPARFRD